MENRKKQAKTDADKVVKNVKSRGASREISAAQVEVKPEVVKNIPGDMGRHGSDAEKELNPEE